MDNSQGAKFMRYTRMKQFHTDHLTEINGAVPGFADEITVLGGQIDEINRLDQLASTDISGYTEDKKNARILLSDTFLYFANAIRIYATRVVPDEILAGKATLTKSDIDGFETENLPNEAQVIYDLAAPLVAATPNALLKWGITAAKLEVFQDAITDFRTKIDSPREAELENKGYRQQLVNTFDAADETVVSLKLMSIMLPDTLQISFENSYKLENVPTRQTGVDGIITANGQPLNGVTVKCTVTKDGKTKEYEAEYEADGKFKINIPGSGVRTLNFTRDGYQTLQREVTLVMGHRIDIEVTMLSASGS